MSAQFTFPKLPDNLATLGSELTTLLNGGVEWEVLTADGKSEKVKVRQLPIRLLKDFDTKQFDEAALVELYAGKSEGWDDTLTLTSHEQLIALGDAVNASFFDRLRDRMVKRLAAVQASVGQLKGVGVPVQPVTINGAGPASSSASTTSLAPSLPPVSSITDAPST